MSVPQVASPSASHHAHRPTSANAARPAEHGASSLFESLVDDNSSVPQPAQAAGPTPAQGQAQAVNGATAAGGKIDAGKAGAGQTQAAADPSGAAPATTAPGDATAGAAAAAIVVQAGVVKTDGIKTDGAKTDSAKTDAAKADAKTDTAKADGTKTDAGADATAGASAPIAVDPVALADAAVAAVVAPAAAHPTDQSAATGTAGAAVNTAVQGAAATAPTQPAFIAATAAQTLQAFDGKGLDGKTIDGKTIDGKTIDGKPGDKAKPETAAASAAAKTAAPVVADGKPAEPQGIQPASGADANPDTKPAAAVKDDTVKGDAHHARPDAASSVTARLDAAATGTDPTSGAQATAARTGATGIMSGAATPGSAASAAAATPAALLAPSVPLSGLAIEIAGKAQAGNNQFAIRLDPPELGRIEVKLAVDRQGQVTSHLIADRADTLDLLRRDAGGLERALQDAGLKTSSDGLQFSLRDQSFAGQQNGRGQANTAPDATANDSLPALDIAANGYTRYTGRVGGVDIRV